MAHRRYHAHSLRGPADPRLREGGSSEPPEPPSLRAWAMSIYIYNTESSCFAKMKVSTGTNFMVGRLIKKMMEN